MGSQILYFLARKSAFSNFGKQVSANILGEKSFNSPLTYRGAILLLHSANHICLSVIFNSITTLVKQILSKESNATYHCIIISMQLKLLLMSFSYTISNIKKWYFTFQLPLQCESYHQKHVTSVHNLSTGE